MEEAGILEKITRSGFCYPALNQVHFRCRQARRRGSGGTRQLPTRPSDPGLSREKKKNRPENQFRTTTSPLVVRHQSTGRLVEGLNLRGTNLESRPCQEKGRTGGRARRPARPLAGSRFTRGKTTVASGVAAYNLEAARALLFLSLLRATLLW